MIHGIHHIGLHTPNIDQMARFYSDAFGFLPVGGEMRWRDSRAMDRCMGVEASAGRIVMLRAGNCYLELFEFASPKGRDAQPLHPQDHGYTHLCIGVTDLLTEKKRLEAAGMTFPDELYDGGESRAIYGRDVDGNIVELFETGTTDPFRLSELTGFKFK